VRKLLFIAFLLIVTACSGHTLKALDQAISATPGNRQLALVIHASPEFMAMTADRSMFVNADVDKAFADGNRLVQENQISDPADRICRMMAAVLGSKYGLTYNESALIRTKSKKADDLVRLANGRDFLLDVETEYWYFINKEHKQPKYFVKYIASLRVINAKSGALISTSSCDYDTVIGGNPLASYEELVADNGAYIKQSLDDAATFCVAKFSGELR